MLQDVVVVYWLVLHCKVFMLFCPPLKSLFISQQGPNLSFFRGP